MDNKLELNDCQGQEQTMTNTGIGEGRKEGRKEGRNSNNNDDTERHTLRFLNSPHPFNIS